MLYCVKCGKKCESGTACPKCGGKLLGPDEYIADLTGRAGQGEAEAQLFLGRMYDKGEDVKQDYTEAAKWYQKAAEQGKAAAQNNLGYMYHNGEGVKQDYA